MPTAQRIAAGLFGAGAVLLLLAFVVFRITLWAGKSSRASEEIGATGAVLILLSVACFAGIGLTCR